MLIILCLVAAIIIGRVNGKSLKGINLAFAFTFLLIFIVLDELKMIIFYSFPMISEFLFVYVLAQYVIFFVIVIKYFNKLPTIIFALGGLFNIAVITSNFSMMPVSSAVNSMRSMQVFARWMDVRNIGYIVTETEATLRILSDIIPIPMFTTGLLSIGDILIAVGAGAMTYFLMKPKTTAKRARHARKKITET